MTISIELDTETEARLAAAVQRQGVAAPDIIRSLVRDYLPPVNMHVRVGDIGGKTLGDIISEIGFADGGPPDVARHPDKYVRGFDETKARRNMILCDERRP